MFDKCRLCLTEENLSPLFGNPGETDNYTNVLSETTGLKIEPNDGLPQKICNKCQEDVQSASLLRNRSQLSEIELIKQRLHNHENTTKIELITLQVEENVESIEKYDTSVENDASSQSEEKIEIQCDRLKQDGEATWPPRQTVKKLSRKDKRRQYMELVEGVFDPSGPVKCKVCKKTVSTWSCFLSHAKLHLGFNFICEFCGKSFISTTQLKRHCRSYHGLERNLQCKQCSYLALDNTQLTLHIRRLHTFERPYICDTCNASYHSRRCLVQHLESHRPIATVQCDQCPQVFKSARQLSRHRYRTHNRRAQEYRTN